MGLSKVSHVDYIRQVGSAYIALVMWLIKRGELQETVQAAHRLQKDSASIMAVGHLIPKNSTSSP